MNPRRSATQPATESKSPSAPSVATFEDLTAVDPRIAALIHAEEHRQREKLVFIASESICPAPVREAVASEFSNLYAEGYPSTRMAVWERERLDWDARHLSFYRRYGDRRYYKGCEYVNAVEAEAIRRLTNLFANDRVAADAMYANVQSLSGAAANNAVYEALVPPQATVLGMNLSCGGHLTHGSPVNRSGKHYRIVDYGVDLEAGKIDFEALAALAAREKPALIIAGYSAYPWTIDWASFRRIADDCGAYLLADIAHPAGLVAAGEFPSPLGHAHVVSFTTHKTLCGPRGAAILTTNSEIARAVDFAVFPAEQGGPHINAIAGKAVAFKLAQTEEFRRLQHRVRENASALAFKFAEAGFSLAYGGTDTHLCLLNLHKTKTETGKPIAADIAARVLDLVGITCNKNAIAGDTRAAHPNGLRFGTTWVSQRGLGPDDMAVIAGIVGDVLHSTRAFQVRTAAGAAGRVRLPAAVLRDARRSVRTLVDKIDGKRDGGIFYYPHYNFAGALAPPRPRLQAFQDAVSTRSIANRGEVASSYATPEEEARRLDRGAVVDTAHVPLIQVAGERADLALQQVLNVDIMRLKPGQTTHACALTETGEIIDQVLVLRQNDFDEFSCYLLIGGAESGLELTEWLRDLSDGMVSFDEDFTRKVDGPVVVEDLAAHHDPLQRHFLITLTGAKTAEILAAAGVALAGDGWVEVEFEQRQLLAILDRKPGREAVRLVVPADVAESLAQTLLGQAEPVGDLAFQARHCPDEVPVAEVERTKPFFIGQMTRVTDWNATKDRFTEPEPDPGVLKKTPLNDWHRAHTKKFNLVPFAGWEMPVMYSGIVSEHRAVRSSAGLFDVAHMGVMEVRGEGAARFLDLVTTNYPTRLRNSEGQYTYTLAPSGEVLDDLLVYRLEQHRFLVVVNAANADKVLAWWQGVAAHRYCIDPDRPSVTVDVDVEVLDLKDESAGEQQKNDLALQGPASLPTLLDLCDGESHRQALRKLMRFQLAPISLRGKKIFAARTGYTGEEIGYELYVHPNDAVAIWEGILEAGRERSVQPAGLGARDSTRTEAGFPLYGHELAGEFNITPFGAGYSSFVKWHKPFFIGRQKLMDNEKKRDHRIMRALVTEPSARPIRQGDTVVDGKGRFVGRVTSAAFAGSDQILLVYGKRHMVRAGDRIGIFPLPRNKKALPQEPRKDALALGDSVLLPIGGQIIPRFMSAMEKKRRSYTR